MIMDYSIDNILNYLGFKSGIPTRWGYTKISSKLREYGVEYDIKLEEQELLNDFTGLADNEGRYFVYMFGENFSDQELYHILKEILKDNDLTDILTGIIVEYADQYEMVSIEILPDLKTQLLDTRKVLAGKYQKVDEYLTKALTKLVSGHETRNALDDLRFALEQLIQIIYSNSKTLENNIEQLRKDIKAKAIEPNVISMVGQLLTFYPAYQSTHVKHHDSFNPNSAEFIFDITTTIIKFIVKSFKFTH